MQYLWFKKHNRVWITYAGQQQPFCLPWASRDDHLYKSLLCEKCNIFFFFFSQERRYFIDFEIGISPSAQEVYKRLHLVGNYKWIQGNHES